MKQLLLILTASISLISLAIYDFLCICRILKEEYLVEKIWKQILPNRQYNEKIFFIMIRPIFLHISSITFLLSAKILMPIPVFWVFLFLSPLLSIINITRK